MLFFNRRLPKKWRSDLTPPHPAPLRVKNGEHILLQTVIIKSPSNERQINIMLDGFSTHTIIHENAIPWLKVKFVSSSVQELENFHKEESDLFK